MDDTKLIIEAGELRFCIEGNEKFVAKQIAERKDHIEAILKEQLRIIKGGKASGARRGRPPGRPAGKKSARKAGAGRRPGRQPLIVRDSNLNLPEAKVNKLREFIETASGGGKLGKDATVFAIAYYLCTDVLKSDSFSAGDVIAAHQQLGKIKGVPTPGSVDVVQMLRNLAATSIGKVWVSRDPDGTFSLTAKGKAAGESGQIQRQRGRKAAPGKKAVKKAAKKAGKRGRPKKAVSAKTAVKKTGKRGRPKKVA